MARAKRTDRAEARRRYRANVVDPLDEGDLDPSTDLADGPTAPARPTGGPRVRASASPAAAAPQRTSITGAFRSSFRPADLRGDLRALPQILTHWSLYVPIILAGLSVAHNEPMFGATGVFLITKPLLWQNLDTFDFIVVVIVQNCKTTPRTLVKNRRIIYQIGRASCRERVYSSV